jgi:hypothetical protein
MSDIVLALKPKWLNLILQGKKTIECRRQMPKKLEMGDKVYFYCQGKLHGYGTAYDIHRFQKDDFDELMSLVDVFHHDACLSVDDMGEYLWDGTSPGLIFLNNIHVYDELQPWNYPPPQNFVYAPDPTAPKHEQLKLL